MAPGPSRHLWLHSRIPPGNLCDHFWQGKPSLPSGTLGIFGTGSRSCMARLHLLQPLDFSPLASAIPLLFTFSPSGRPYHLYSNRRPLAGAFLDEALGFVALGHCIFPLLSVLSAHQVSCPAISSLPLSPSFFPLSAFQSGLLSPEWAVLEPPFHWNTPQVVCPTWLLELPL